MRLADRLRALDDRAFNGNTNTRWRRWGDQWAWVLYLGLSLMLLAVAGWALSAGHPGMAPGPFVAAVFGLGLAWFFFGKRPS